MATLQQTRDLDAWLTEYTQAQEKANAGTVAAALAAYATVNDWFDPRQTVEAAKSAADAMQVASRTQSGLMAEFIEMCVQIATGKRPRTPVGIGGYARNARPFEVYSRPIFDARRAIEAEFQTELARQRALDRAEQLALTDAALARRATAAKVMEAANVAGYRRVIRPELAKTGTCGLCIAAATQRYKTAKLMPLHTGCHCVPMPILDGIDPGAFNQADLKAAYADAPGTERRDLSKTRFQVSENGELGPVLEPAAKQRGVPRIEPPTKSGAGDGGRKGPPRNGILSPDDPDKYPETNTGKPPPFTPSTRPHISRGSRKHILQRHGRSGTGITRFSWSDDRIMEAVDATLARPDSVEHWSDQFVFLRKIDDETVRVSVRTDKPHPFIWTAYPTPKA